MIDLNATNEWQHRDPSTGLVFPWYTKSFLDELVTWDLKEKTVFEFGCGASTLWWSAKMPVVYGAESDFGYHQAVIEALEAKGQNDWYIVHDPEFDNPFSMFPDDYKPEFEIIVVDCEPIQLRDKCIAIALNHLKPGSRLIIDNWGQPSVGWLPSEETKALLAPYPCKVYPQEGHPDWKTLLVTVP